MSHWNHLLCERCFMNAAPARVPHRVVDAVPAVCCRCGTETASHIFFRDDPKGYKYCGLNTGGPDAT